MFPLPVSFALSLVLLLRLSLAPVPLVNDTLRYLWSVPVTWLDDHFVVFARWPQASWEERWAIQVTLCNSSEQGFWLEVVNCLPLLLGSWTRWLRLNPLQGSLASSALLISSRLLLGSVPSLSVSPSSVYASLDRVAGASVVPSVHVEPSSVAMNTTPSTGRKRSHTMLSDDEDDSF